MGNLLGGEYFSLSDRSPFCSKRHNPEHLESDTKKDVQFELHGILRCEGKYIFSLHNKETHKNIWLKLNDYQFGVNIRKYFPKNKTIEVSLPTGEVCLLKLRPILSKSCLTSIGNEPVNYAAHAGYMVDEAARKNFLNSIQNGD